MVMQEYRQGQNTGLDDPYYREFRGREWLKGFIVSETHQGIMKATARSMEAGGAALESDDLDSNHLSVLVSV